MAHIHVGSNMPGYIPERDVDCYGVVSSALESLKDEIKTQQDFYYEGCEDSTPEGCECAWCSVAGDCEAAISAIGDNSGDAAAWLERDGRVGWTFSPPVGADMSHWAVKEDGSQEDCLTWQIQTWQDQE